MLPSPRALAPIVVVLLVACRTDKPDERQLVRSDQSHSISPASASDVNVITIHHGTCQDIASAALEMLAASKWEVPPELGFISAPSVDGVSGESSHMVLAHPVRNAVLIRAPPADVPRIVDLIQRLDDAALDGRLIPQSVDHEVGLIVLRHENSYKFAQALDASFASADRHASPVQTCLLKYPPEWRPLVCVADEGRNAVIMRGRSRDVKDALEHIRWLDELAEKSSRRGQQ